MNTRILTMLCLLVASFFAGPPAHAQEEPAPGAMQGQAPYVPKDPPFAAFTDQNGRKLGFGNFEGQVLLVNYWATWCGPCVKEMPVLDQLQQEYGPRGFKVIAVSQDESMQQVHAFYAQKRLQNLEVFMDDNGISFANMGVNGLPTSIVIDSRGKEAVRFTGLIDWNSKPARYVLEDLLRRRETGTEVR